MPTTGQHSWCTGNQLAHPADVVAIAAGGVDSPLFEHAQGREGWQTAVTTLEQLLGEIQTWPASRLPTVQEAAMQLVRGISRHIPEEGRGLPDMEQAWWTMGSGTWLRTGELPAHENDTLDGSEADPVIWGEVLMPATDDAASSQCTSTSTCDGPMSRMTAAQA